MLLFFLPRVLCAGTINIEQLFDDTTDITAGTTGTAYLWVNPASDGHFTLFGKMVSYSGDRAVSIDAYVCDDTANNCALDNQLVVNWETDSNTGDADTIYKVGGKNGISLGKAPVYKFVLTGLTGCEVSPTFWIAY